MIRKFDLEMLQASNRRCGLPPFVDDLPENEKKEIISVWKDYKQGDECVDERQETQEIVSYH